MKTEAELTEQVFRKMGWEKITWVKDLSYIDNGDWIHPDKDGRVQELPPIDSQWEVTAKYLVPFMREKGYKYNLESDGYFWWVTKNSRRMWIRDQGEEIKDDNIAEAACKAFMEVELNEKT